MQASKNAIDVFDAAIMLCKKCGRKMQKGIELKQGFKLRYWYCKHCGIKVYHPGDLAEYKQFKQLSKRVYKVKLRIVGNSYAVTLPKEIVRFLQEQERVVELAKIYFEKAKKLALCFE